jgi:thioester reductase-like protein
MQHHPTGSHDGAARHPGSVLLTGATGFLGGHLLRRLVTNDPRPIVCVVRADSIGEATARGARALATSLGRPPSGGERRRVFWLAGDVTRPRLGLRPNRWARLAESVEEIFHCAASTRFDLALDDAHRINVGGLETVYDLACAAVDTRSFRRLNQVSTAYASGRASTRVGADALPPDRPRAFRNTYERTKARAERLLRSQARVPYTIYRPSIIVGDSRDGRTSSWNVVYFPMRLMASGQLPVAPADGGALLDCVPVDFVADAILTLAGRADTAGRGFHVTAGSDALTVHDVVQHTYAGIARRHRTEMRTGTRLLGPVAWWAFATACRLVRGAHVRRALDRFAPYTRYTRISTVYDSSAERELLAKHGVRLAAPEEFFPRVVDYALRHDFGRRPAPPVREPAPPPTAAASAGEM